MKDASKKFFRHPFVNCLLFLEEIHLKSPESKLKFYKLLAKRVDEFPAGACLHKILPLVMEAVRVQVDMVTKANKAAHPSHQNQSFAKRHELRDGQRRVP